MNISIKWVLILLFIIGVLAAGMLFGVKMAGGMGAGLLALLFGAKKKTEKNKEKAEQIEKESDERAEKVDDLEEQADKIEQSTDDREEKAEQIKQDAAEQEDKLNKLDDKYKDLLSILLIILLSISLFSPAIMAQNIVEVEKAESLEQANKIIVDLTGKLNEARTAVVDYRDQAYGWKNKYEQTMVLYEEEKADHEETKQIRDEWKSMYMAERDDSEQLQTIIGNQRDIIDTLSNAAGSGFGIYGGVNYKPFKPLESGLEGGITVDF